MSLKNRNWQFWGLFLGFIVFPTAMAALFPKFSVAWNMAPAIVLVVIAAYFIVSEALPKKLAYSIDTNLKQILVKFGNDQTVTLSNGTDIIELHMAKDKHTEYLWIRDSMVNGTEVVVKETPIGGRRVYLNAGEFFVTREVAGYIVRWTSSTWEVV